MKKSLFFAACAAAMIFASCQKDASGTVTVPEDGNPVDVELSVMADEPTRSTGLSLSSESAIHNVQYFVFSRSDDDNRSLNMIEAVYKTPENAGDNTSKVTVSLSSGAKIIRAVVNCPALEKIKTEADLDSRRIMLPEYVEKGSDKKGLVMNGRHEINVSQDQGVEVSGGGQLTATVKVTRVVSKISIEKVTPAFRSDYYAGLKFTINNIWIVNAPADIKLQSTLYTPTVYWNTASMELDKPIVGDVVNTVVSGAAYNATHTFYTFPGTEDSKVLLCVEVTVGEGSEMKHFYYSIDVAKRLSTAAGRIEANKKYTISELKIRMPGTSDPKVVVEKDVVEIPVIEVDEWKTDISDSYTEEI